MDLMNRRRASRQPVGWLAKYHPAGPWDAWYRCQAVDVSPTGVGLILFGPTVASGDGITVQLVVDDGQPTSGVHLRGTVRNSTSSADGTMRVGVEFVSLTPVEESLFAALRTQESMAAVPDPE
jgi:c-di-GMP-binding flagellar brake protein YcgR